MKNIKDITISIFAVIGFVAIISGFTNEAEQPQTTTPESHVWEMHIYDAGYNPEGAYAINKVTGEVRKYQGGNISANAYIKMLEKLPKQKK